MCTWCRPVPMGRLLPPGVAGGSPKHVLMGRIRDHGAQNVARVIRGSPKHITTGTVGAHEQTVGNGDGGGRAPPWAPDLGRGVRLGLLKNVSMVAARTHRPLFGAGVVRRSANNVAAGAHRTHGAHEGGGVAARSRRTGRGGSAAVAPRQRCLRP
ncbi:ORF R U13 [Macacine gammaherpesvirus 5]|uniref:ORFRU13-L n=1 Tax=Rhesus monkey rhadinovirus H26-95 TaxID=69256 RepID=Q9J2H4_9GAMA|nr:ORFRU13-L [Rhesus monkey rhadinovirus H26-95]QFN51689.1 ORF R U13 [Macacine gammaherpesvirus 5]QFN51780.1 ORF R U13 [Macacine gammaherpesvirus 5]QFN51872.1 ORF R U13 [Macacine gammaherpesvirus 5]